MDQFHIRPHETKEPFQFCSGHRTQEWGLDGVRVMSPLFTRLLWGGGGMLRVSPSVLTTHPWAGCCCHPRCTDRKQSL